ncbi:MAG TPA: response regulator transcription factor [Thermoleophilaceae bacterium]
MSLQSVPDPVTRVLIACGESLRRAGYRVVLEGARGISVAGEATTGREAVELTRQLRPHAVVMDLCIADYDCVEATRRLSAELGVPVIVLSALESDERIYGALRAGATGVLSKDTAPAGVIKAIEVATRGDAVLSPGLTRRLIAELVSRPEPSRPSGTLVERLTAREREVVSLVAMGLSNGEIAERLVVSSATARTHVSRAMVKLRARDRAQLVVFAYESGLLVQPSPRAGE